MSGVNYHGWTHRPKALGGTDPIAPTFGDVPWIRAKQTTGGQAWTANDEKDILYDDVLNEYPDYFSIDNPDTLPQFHILVPGLYQITTRVDVDVAGALSFPADGMEISFVGIDYDNWVYYSTFIEGTRQTSDTGYAELTFRGGPTNTDPNPSWLEVKVITFADPMQIEQGGTYTEIRYLAGDPLWPLGLLNDTLEA